jgi:hypothetical protein
MQIWQPLNTVKTLITQRVLKVRRKNNGPIKRLGKTRLG